MGSMKTDSGRILDSEGEEILNRRWTILNVTLELRWSNLFKFKQLMINTLDNDSKIF